jgi:hypothetical protein
MESGTQVSLRLNSGPGVVAEAMPPGLHVLIHAPLVHGPVRTFGLRTRDNHRPFVLSSKMLLDGELSVALKGAPRLAAFVVAMLLVPGFLVRMELGVSVVQERAPITFLLLQRMVLLVVPFQLIRKRKGRRATRVSTHNVTSCRCTIVGSMLGQQSA